MATQFAHNLITAFFKRSLWIVVILSLVLSIVVPTLIYFYQLHHYENESAELLDRFIQREMRFKPGDMLNNPVHRENTVKRISIFMEFSNLVEFKIWMADGTLVYAYTSPELTGHMFPGNVRLAETVRTGKPTVEIESTRDSENMNLAPYGKLVEMYAPLLVDGKVEGAVEVYRMAPKFRFLKAHIITVVSIAVLFFLLLYALLYGRFSDAVSELFSYDVRLRDAYKSLGLSYFDTIRSLIKALELRDMETEGHSERVVALSLYIGKMLKISESELDKLVLGSYLHDIGKIGVSDCILLKPGSLSASEESVMKSHVLKGLEIIGNIEFLGPATEVVRYHHEKWDGSGYIEGLKGEDIPVTARIFAVVDVFDALISDRPYRKALPFDDAKEIIRKGKGTHFDPEIVDIFLDISQKEYDLIKSVIAASGIYHTVNAAVESLLGRLHES